jgi:hypothetical protein
VLVAVKEIVDGNVVLARHISADEWGAGLKFFSEPSEFIQVGIWGYAQGQVLRPHVHQEVAREAPLTQEVLYVRRGSLEARVYNRDEQVVETLVAREGDILAMLYGGHGYTILEDGTQVLEIKNGPYPGAEKDRRRIDER